MSSFGKTWWGEQWLKALNNIDYSNRLPRGKSYANKGAVNKVSITENKINARVKGTQKKPYTIIITIPKFNSINKDHFIKELSQNPVLISKLLNRELDPLLLDMAENRGLRVFPRQWTDLKMKCSCPDWAVPCKHIAAVIYKLCEEIDNDPFIVFDIHDLSLTKELSKYGVRISKSEQDVPKLKSFISEPIRAQEVIKQQNAYQKLNYTLLTPIHESLISLLSKNPPFYNESSDFKKIYNLNIKKSIDFINKLILGQLNMDKLFTKDINNIADINIRTEVKLQTNLNNETIYIIGENAFSFTQVIKPISQIQPEYITNYQPSVAAIHTTFHFACHLIANGAIAPQIVHLDNKKFCIRWLPALLSKEVRILCDKYEMILPSKIIELNNKNKTLSIKDQHINTLSIFISEIIHHIHKDLTLDQIHNLFFCGAKYEFKEAGEKSLCGGIQTWLQKYFISQSRYKPILIIEEGGNNTFLMQISVKDSQHKYSMPIALHKILTLKKHESIRYTVLQSLIQLSTLVPRLNTYINTGAKEKAILTYEEFLPFLFEMIPTIRLIDIDVMLPVALNDIIRPKLTMRLKKASLQQKGYISFDQIFAFDWKVALGDEFIDYNEFKKLLKKSEGLLYYRSSYIYVNKEDLRNLMTRLSGDNQLSSGKLLQTALSGEYEGAKVELTNDVKALIEELTQVDNINLPKRLKATLRPYQERGYSWLYRNAKIGMGSILADDMGLGKTLQVIALLLKYKEEKILHKHKAIVIVPTGLLLNWESELKKFAPSLKSFIYHGTTRTLPDLKTYDVLITSFGIARSDVKKFQNVSWHTLVIDEAQNIKNINTAQTKAVKNIPAKNYIALSGTPVENRLSELWSIMDYANRGFLGRINDFNNEFGIPIQEYNDIQKAEKLKQITSPFLMRRLKTDKKIIADLPDKIESDSFAKLTPEQASLYEGTLQKALKDIEEIKSDNNRAIFAKKSLVLQMILALKQICNHPALFLKNNDTDPLLSGKMQLLFDKLDSIAASNEKVLIFSQFAQMGKLLQSYISDRYNDEPLFYHGKNTIKERQIMIDKFQNNRAEKIFILSLKAAGTGLNLTSAQHVIHYDLWWNPAVENQATDRAYRIGQKNNVMVHRFITQNTFEERINEIIQQKKRLADMTISSGENWIGNLNNKELRQIFEIR
ncbi:MAG: DEAD/DEAH box helicase [Bacteroidales bacterium]|nr:DEAD/DEAH box helicase [Bacteroidales bacterium]